MTPPPPAPSTSAPTTFAALADAFVAWMATFVSECTAVLALSTSVNNTRIVDVADSTGLAIATAYAAGQVIDGVTLTTGMRVLRATPTQHLSDGIYTVPASGAASRSVDANNSALLPSGLDIKVTRGTAHIGSRWNHKTAPGFTLDTTALYFTKYNEVKEVSITSQGVVGGTQATIASFTLQPGRYELSGLGQERGSGAGANVYGEVGISTTTNSLAPCVQGKSRTLFANYLSGGSAPYGTGAIPGFEVNPTVATTYFLVVSCLTNSDSFDGSMRAKRLD